MDTLINFIKEWGYFAVFLGSLIEGESVILTSSFLASIGYFKLYKLMIVAFFGTLVADQALYQVGRAVGPNLLKRIIKRFPSTEKPIAKCFRFLENHSVIYMLSFRFIYGIRILSPLVIGSAGVPLGRFALFNAIAAAIWSILSCLAGYYVGYFFIYKATTAQKIFIPLGIVAVIALKVYGFKKIKNYYNNQRLSRRNHQNNEQ